MVQAMSRTEISLASQLGWRHAMQAADVENVLMAGFENGCEGRFVFVKIFNTSLPLQGSGMQAVRFDADCTVRLGADAGGRGSVASRRRSTGKRFTSGYIRYPFAAAVAYTERN